MPPPLNTSAANATPLVMNTTLSLDVSEAAAPLHEVWFRYTATAADSLVGYYAAANPAGTYVPVTSFLQGSDPDDLDAFMGFGALVTDPVQFSLVDGTTYYYRVRHNGAAVALTDPLQLSFTRGPSEAAVAGSLLINDDAPGFPLVILSATDGAVLQTRPYPFPSGETGAVIPSGFTVWHDYNVDPAVVRLYDATLTLVATSAWTFHGAAPPLSSNRSDTFYLGDPGTTFPSVSLARVGTMDTTGALGPTVWTLPEVGLNDIAVSPDDAVLYLRGQATGGGAIQRWDLVNDVALANHSGTVAGYSTRQMLVLADGTLVIGYAKTTQDLSELRHYAASGTLLNTWSLGAVDVTRLAHALDDPASVWAWSWDAGHISTRSRFQHVRLSDGVILVSFTVDVYEGGSYSPVAPAPPPPAPAFGISPSCPFLLFPPPDVPTLPPPVVPPVEPPPVEPPLPGAPGYHLEARYIRRLRRAPHVNNEHLRVFYRRFELDLERGQALASGQGSDPYVLLRLSRDGGQTWGEELRMAAGRLGEYQARVMARRLGHSRDTVFEIVVSDPVAWSIVGAFLDLEPGAH